MFSVKWFSRGAWRRYAKYDTEGQAMDVVRMLRLKGHEARIDVVTV